jgi:5,10-methylenetetrahydromethanopterin reductase
MKGSRVQAIMRELKGEKVDYRGEVINFTGGRLSFAPVRANIPVYVASNGPLGQRAAGAVADGVIMEACAAAEEVRALRAEVDRGARQAGRDPASVKLIARLNTCIAGDGRAAREAVRPTVARLLGAGRLKFAAAEARQLALPAEAMASVAGAAYADGVKPYLPLLPLISDRHVDAFMLAGTVEEVAEHVVVLRRAGIDSIIAVPFAPDGGSIEDTVVKFGSEVWPRVRALGL